MFSLLIMGHDYDYYNWILLYKFINMRFNSIFIVQVILKIFVAYTVFSLIPIGTYLLAIRGNVTSTYIFAWLITTEWVTSKMSEDKFETI